MAELIEMLFGELTHVGPRNHVLTGQERMNPLAAARGDKSAMRPFAKLFWTLVVLVVDGYIQYIYETDGVVYVVCSCFPSCRQRSRKL